MEGKKKQLRREIQKELEKIPPTVRQAYYEKIRENLYQLEPWRQAKTIGITVSRGNEIDTYPIIQRAWEEGKSVAVPKCFPDEFTMDFRIFNSFDQLEVVYFGLQEPIISQTKRVEPVHIDFQLVPGLAFDGNGYRVGFGGGYYDRYLQRYKNPTASILLPVQFVERVPRGSFDKPVDHLVFPDEIYKITE